MSKLKLCLTSLFFSTYLSAAVVYNDYCDLKPISEKESKEMNELFLEKIKSIYKENNFELNKKDCSSLLPSEFNNEKNEAACYFYDLEHKIGIKKVKEIIDLPFCLEK